MEGATEFKGAKIRKHFTKKNIIIIIKIGVES